MIEYQIYRLKDEENPEERLRIIPIEKEVSREDFPILVKEAFEPQKKEDDRLNW